MSAPTARPRVLTVDDEPQVRELVVRTLEQAGWEVDVADDGETALAKVGASRPDIVLLDVRMPGMGGLELLERLRQDARPPAVVALTALGDYDTFAGLVQGGAAAYLSKPFSPQDLVELCERVLRAVRRPKPVPDERRREPRREIMVGVKVITSPERGPLALGTLANLSRGGAQVDLVTPLELGRQVLVGLHVGLADSPLSFQGQVRWRLGFAHCFTHGIAFAKLAPELEARLKELLAPKQ
jgi:CheY-like chemotaxis protein